MNYNQIFRFVIAFEPIEPFEPIYLTKPVIMRNGLRDNLLVLYKAVRPNGTWNYVKPLNANTIGTCKTCNLSLRRAFTVRLAYPFTDRKNGFACVYFNKALFPKLII